MIFATFYHKSAISNQLIEACGDRAVIVLDGRNTMSGRIALAKDECAKRGYLGYVLHCGDTFTRSKPITSLQLI